MLWLGERRYGSVPVQQCHDASMCRSAVAAGLAVVGEVVGIVVGVTEGLVEIDVHYLATGSTRRRSTTMQSD
jgi:hypothetical protein